MTAITIKSSAMVLGAMMIVFGLNKFLGFIPVEPPADPTAQAFMGAMFASYLYVVVAVAEILGGTFLLTARFRVLGFLLLAPIVFNIVAFHVAHDFVGNGIWLVPTALFAIVGVGIRDDLVRLVQPDLTQASAAQSSHVRTKPAV